jgi:cell wall-associated NlpC family hydrolase
MARVKGSGVDCAMLLAEVYEEAGMVEHIEVPPYSMQWHLHRDVEKLLEIVEHYARPTEDPKPGDIILFQFGRTHSHAAILVDSDGGIVHAMRDVGVVQDNWQQHCDLNTRKKIFYSPWSA